MNKFLKYTDLLRNGLFIMIILNIILKHKATPAAAILYGGIFLAAILNDNLRYNHWYNNRKKFTISLLVSLGICTFLMFKSGGNTSIYYFFLLYDIIVFLEGKMSHLFLVVHFLIFVFVFFIYNDLFTENIFSLEYWKSNILDYLIFFLFYSMTIFLYYSFKYNIKERWRVQKLNNELQEANKKLKEYSLKVEELTIQNERNRVAQEIHDSLGHSLTALIMHLDFLEKIVDSNSEKAKEVVIKSQSIARNSMQDVRKAIYALKAPEISKGLIYSIESLVENLTVSQGIKFTCNITGDDIEIIDLNIKNIIYITIKEGITNGIKHGCASEFYINLKKMDKSIKLTIKDNGKGCEKIIYGNGLKGMIDRVNAVAGTINFCGNIAGGFMVEVFIPA